MNSSSPLCDLCGLPLRKQAFTLSSSDRTYRFCCNGCKQVFRMLAEKHGANDPASFRASELFKKCGELGIIPGPEQGLAASAHAIGKKDGVPSEGESRLRLNLKVIGMWCPACAWVIEESLNKMPGVSHVQCSFSSDRMRCDYDPVVASPSRIRESLVSLGYDAFPPEDSWETKERRREILRFAVSSFLTMNIMTFSFALYAGFITEFSHGTVASLSWPMFIMASIVLFYGGARIYRRAWAGFVSAAFSMETLITMGAFSAYLYSTYQLLSGSLHLYYDTASMLIVLVSLGKFIESRAKARVQEGFESLFSLRPSKVKIVAAGQDQGGYVSAEQLQKGDLFLLEEGEIAPADGRIAEGRASVDESSLTGEALPVPKASGDHIRSGSRIIQGRLKVRTEKVGSLSTLGQMLEILESALKKDHPLQGKTDRIMRWFVPAVVALAAGTGLGCLAMGLSMESAILRTLTVLVISCPCTLGIAVPLARVAGISLAGRKGILVREFSSFERAETLGDIVFDKTGTITHGQWTLLEIIPLGPIARQEALTLAASLEQESEHFVAKEITRNANEAGLELTRPLGVNISERGLSGCVRDREVKIGSRNFLKQELTRCGAVYRHLLTPTLPPPSRGRRPLQIAQLPPPPGGCTIQNSPPLAGGVRGGGATLESDPGDNALVPASDQSHVYMSVNGDLSAIFVFGDEIKQEAPEVIRELETMKLHLYLVSGDGDEATKAVGRKVGIPECHGGLLPEDKAAFVRRVQGKDRRAAMVGDGINDAPALAQADLGIGVSSGFDLGKEAGGITLMRGDLGLIPVFLRLAKRVNKKIRQNLLFSALYNLVAIPIAMIGLLNPLIAVSAMLLSSLTVIGNTLLLIRTNRS